MWRAIAAAVAFAAAATSGSIAAVTADDKSLGWWVAIGVLIAVGAVLQGIVTMAEPKLRTVASGAGAVAIGGSSTASVQTRVSGAADAATNATGGIAASAPGAVSIGGNSSGSVNTNVDIPKASGE